MSQWGSANRKGNHRQKDYCFSGPQVPHLPMHGSFKASRNGYPAAVITIVTSNSDSTPSTLHSNGNGWQRLRVDIAIHVDLRCRVRLSTSEAVQELEPPFNVVSLNS